MGMIFNSLRNYRNNRKTQNSGNVEYINFWDGQSANEIWFTGFLEKRGFFARYPDVQFVFISTLGSPNVLLLDEILHPLSCKRKRIFFTGENVHYDFFKPYQDNWVKKKSISLSLGFDDIKDIAYLRFPLWILEMFPSNADEGRMKKICNDLCFQTYSEYRDRFCALVSGTSTLLGPDSLRRRGLMVDTFNKVSSVDCAGRFLHNTDELQSVYNDDKAEFLKRYKFYICPENTSVEGYVTEKIFHSIGSGCIPIYYGSLNNPEPDVLNHDAIIFWDQDGDNSATIKKVEELWNNPKLYQEFFEQPRLQPHAWEVVAEYFSMLEKKLDEICRR